MSYKFKTDTERLHKWLKNRVASLESTRKHFLPLWREIRQHFEPSIGKSLLEGDDVDAIAAKRDDDHIINSTPRTLLQRLAAGLQSGITNQSRQWFRLRCMDNDVTRDRAVRQWLDSTTELIQSMLNRSNTYTSLDQIYTYLGAFGTGCAVAVADEDNGVHLEVADIGSYSIAEDRRGRINTLSRKLELTLSQLREEFGMGWLPQQLTEKIEKGELDYRVTVRNLICPHQDWIEDIDSTRLFDSIYWLDSGDGRVHEKNSGILAIRSYSYNPIICPRWAVTRAPYGVGCGEIGLGDAKELQQLESDILRIVELEVDPAMLAPASMKGESVETGAGGITYYPDTLQRSGNAIGRLFETQQRADALLMVTKEVEARLRQIFFADLFALLIQMNISSSKQMTAREVSELSGEKVALLGPILTRLNNDLLGPLIDACFALAIEQGRIPEAPEVLQGQELKIEYVSSLHIEQASSARLNGLYRIVEFTGGLAGLIPNVIDKLDTDRMVDVAAQVLEEHGCVRNDADVQAIREERMRQQMEVEQAKARAEQMSNIGRAAKNLSQAKVGTGNALEAAIQAGGMEGLMG